MSTDKKLPALPEETQQKLMALKGSCPEEFYALVKALRLEGWPLRAIAEPFFVSRTAVQGWEAKFDGKTDLPTIPSLPITPVEDRHKGTKKITLTQEQSEELHRLATEASSVRRFTDENAPSRIAASELERLLVSYSESGVTRVDLAQACGVSDSSIKQRLRKHK